MTLCASLMVLPVFLCQPVRHQAASVSYWPFPEVATAGQQTSLHSSSYHPPFMPCLDRTSSKLLYFLQGGHTQISPGGIWRSHNWGTEIECCSARASKMPSCCLMALAPRITLLLPSQNEDSCYSDPGVTPLPCFFPEQRSSASALD